MDFAVHMGILEYMKILRKTSISIQYKSIYSIKIEIFIH